MSYGQIYIESDIRKMKTAGYKKKYIISTITKRIRYRYPSISNIGAKTIALDAYNGNETSRGWKSRSKTSKPPVITNKDENLWRKLNLSSL